MTGGRHNGDARITGRCIKVEPKERDIKDILHSVRHLVQTGGTSEQLGMDLTKLCDYAEKWRSHAQVLAQSTVDSIVGGK